MTVGIVKSVLYKVIGGAKLRYEELQDAILDTQVVLNKRPLSYCKEDLQLPTSTPNLLIFGKPNYLPEELQEDIKELDY